MQIIVKYRNYMGNSKEETWSLLSPLCAGPVSDENPEDKEVKGSRTSTDCAGPGRMVVETDEDEEGEDRAVGGGPQTLSVSLVPDMSSTSP